MIDSQLKCYQLLYEYRLELVRRLLATAQTSPAQIVNIETIGFMWLCGLVGSLNAVTISCFLCVLVLGGGSYGQPTCG